jgi:hypothetical protein
MQRELTQLLTQRNSATLYLMIICKYDFLNRYKIYIVEDRDKNIRPKTIIKLKTKYKTSSAFMETILKCKHIKPDELQMKVNQLSVILNQNNLVVPRSGVNSEVSSRSRNIQNNLYANKTDRNVHPHRGMAYASERDKQQSIGSTIFRENDTIDPFGSNPVASHYNAMKPSVPRYDNNMFRSSMLDSKVIDQNKIIEEEKIGSYRDNKSEQSLKKSHKNVISPLIYSHRDDERNKVQDNTNHHNNLSNNNIVNNNVTNNTRGKRDGLKIENKGFDMHYCCK